MNYYNIEARCKCEMFIGTCNNIECPHSLSSSENTKFWAEGWAASKYSKEPYVKTQIGSLINKIKYDKEPSYSVSERMRDAKIIVNKIVELISVLYNTRNLPFDVCVSPPSHNEKPLDLAAFICNSISGKSIRYFNDSVIERESLGSVKQMSKYERSAALLDNFVFDPRPGQHPSKGILLVDDVFETGSTLKGVSRAIAAQYPGLNRFVITATYIGQMGKIQAV